MAYPTQSIQRSLEDIDRLIISVKQRAAAAKAKLEAGNVSATYVIDLAINAARQVDELTAAAAVPGIAAYAQSIKNDQNLDVVAEFNTVKAAIEAVKNWVVANFPKDANGYLLRETWGAYGPEDRTFAPATTATLAGLLQTVVDSIN